MKINNPENISEIFAIFHDGKIIKCSREKDSLRMEVEIEYLAKRINPGFKKFMIHLLGVEDILFSTWPNDLKSKPKLFTDTNIIFEPELEILEGHFIDGRTEVICGQDSPDFDYCGGELYLTATIAEVTDEAGKHYSSEELDTLRNGYWAEKKAMTDTYSAITNWHFMWWPTLILWIACGFYVFNSEFESQAGIVLPILMGVSLFLVALINAIAGSIQQEALDMKATFGHQTNCTICGKSDRQLELVKFQYCIWLGIFFTFHREISGKLCRECAVPAINKAFLLNLFGCILCPPAIVFSFLKRQSIVNKYKIQIK